MGAASSCTPCSSTISWTSCTCSSIRWCWAAGSACCRSGCTRTSPSWRRRHSRAAWSAFIMHDSGTRGEPRRDCVTIPTFSWMAHMRRSAWLVAATIAIVACSTGMRASQPDGWIPLFDGKTLNGWRASENPATFRVENGEIVVHGPRAHLFYDGPVRNHEFTDFELKADVLTKPGANSGIFIRTTFQPTGFPSKGYEVQVNNSQSDWRRTGSLYAVRDVRE